MKIQLIHPPVYLNVYALTALRPSLPLGLAYIAAALRKAGHEVSVLDAVGEAPDQTTPGLRTQITALGLTPAEILERVDPEADAIALTNMWSFSWPVVRETIALIKARYPDIPFVCGGEHFSGLPGWSMDQVPIDYVVVGEGEETAAELFAALEEGRDDFASIAGIWYRDADGKPVKSTADRARMKAIDDIAWPAWDLFDVKAYDERNLVTGIHYGMSIPIFATRGCPYQCTYCSSPNMWTTRWYARDPVDVVDELQHWYDTYGANNFPFHDLTAIIKKDWIISFCKEMVDRGLHEKVVWQLPSGTRVEVIDDEVAGWLYRANGKSLNYAPESGSLETRKRIKKKMKDEALFRAVRAAAKHKLVVAAFFIAGFPEDTVDDLKQNVKLVRKLAWHGITDMAFGFFFPIPSTELYEQLVKDGRIELNDDFLLTPIFANEAKLSEENNFSYTLTAQQLTRWRYWTLVNFYAVSYGVRPWRLVSTLWNSLLGRETRKMETFLIDIRRKIRVNVKGFLTGRSRSEASRQAAD